MKLWMPIILCGFLLGCEYRVPLVITPELEIDKTVLGLWERKLDDGKTEKLVLLPLDEREYLVSFSSGSDGMFARACLTRAGEKTLVQVKWLGTAEGELGNTDEVYQFAAYQLSGDTLAVMLLNSDIIKRDAATSEALAKAVQDHITHPDVFREKMVFTKVK